MEGVLAERGLKLISTHKIILVSKTGPLNVGGTGPEIILVSETGPKIIALIVYNPNSLNFEAPLHRE